MCHLQETKLDEITAVTWREIGGSHLNEFAFVLAKRSASGIAFGWNIFLLTRILERARGFSLTVEFISKRDNLRLRCTVVYGPNERSRKHVFLGETER